MLETYFRAPRSVEQARTQAHIRARADTLFKEGYTAYETACKGVWGVYRPDGKGYTVNLNWGQVACDCASFAEHGDCKHRIGLFLKLEEEAYEQMYEAEGGDERYLLECVLQRRPDLDYCLRHNGWLPLRKSCY